MISHIAGTLNTGGIQKFLLNLLSTPPLTKYRHSIICTISDQGDLKEEFSQKKVGIEFCPLVPIDRGWKPYIVWKHLRFFVVNFALLRFFLHFRSNNAQIIHSHSPAHVSSQCIAALLSGKRFLWTIHGEYAYNGFEKMKLRLLINMFGKKHFKIIADSLPALHYTLPFSKKNESAFSIVPTAIDIPTIRKQSSHRVPNRINAGFAENEILVGSVGRLVWEKGYDVMVEAVRMLKPEFRNVKFLIAGEGYLKKELKQMIVSFGLEKQILLMGLINDIPSLLSTLDFYIQPSLSEGFPLATIEAMAAGLPIISTDAGGLKFLLKDNETAVMTEKKDAVKLAAAIEKMLTADQAFINSLKTNAFNKSEEFSAEKIAALYYQQYEKLLN